jgi:hypothetical protein
MLPLLTKMISGSMISFSLPAKNLSRVIMLPTQAMFWHSGRMAGKQSFSPKSTGCMML